MRLCHHCVAWDIVDVTADLLHMLYKYGSVTRVSLSSNLLCFPLYLHAAARVRINDSLSPDAVGSLQNSGLSDKMKLKFL